MTEAKAKTEAEAADEQTDSVENDAAEEATSTLDENAVEPALDHLELAIQSAASHDVDEQFLTGFTMVSGELIRVLANFGLKRIETVDAAFDHNMHEAVSQMPSAEHDEGMVMHEVKSGYMVGDRLLRAAQVVVSAGAPATDDGAES